MSRKPRAKKSGPKEWVEKIFAAKIVANGGVVRRKIHSVATNASEKDLVDAVQSRGFHMVISGDQYVILCNSGNFTVVL